MYTYEEVIERIERARRAGNLPGVEVTGAALKLLLEPQKAFPFVHVAGTNGKGSTCAFLDSCLREAGFRTGLFISPHLIDFEERICVDGVMISKEDVTRIGNELLQIDFDPQPTYFDYCLLIALLYFREQKIDVAVIETGLGGRWDSTNALGTPIAAAIAKIGFDHMAILGDTLSAIAQEKAGIIKDGTHVVTENQEAEALSVLLKTAGWHAVKSLHVLTEEEVENCAKLDLQIKGTHQWENAALAARCAGYVMEELHPDDFSEEKKDAVIRDGLKKAFWPGRLELVSKEPCFIVDGAHNGNGVGALKSSLMHLYPGQKFHFFMGVLSDKDYEEMVEALVPLALDFGTVTPESSRALQAEKLAAYIESFGIPAYQIESIEQIGSHLKKDAVNVAFGSLYYVGELRKYFVQRKR